MLSNFSNARRALGACALRFDFGFLHSLSATAMERTSTWLGSTLVMVGIVLTVMPIEAALPRIFRPWTCLSFSQISNKADLIPQMGHPDD